MPTEWGDEIIRYKYDPLPEEAPRHRKKSKKKHVRSDHKHEYEDVAVIEPHSSWVIYRDGKHKAYHKATRCKICGRVYDIHFHGILDEIPTGMRVFYVDGFGDLFAKGLPENKEVKS